MTDLKPQNTFYDGKNNKGMLIDLSGVVRKPSKADLLHCRVKYVKELTTKFSAPELLEPYYDENQEKQAYLCKLKNHSGNYTGL